MPNGYTYVIKSPTGGQTISTAITILQIKAGAAALELIRAWLTQKGSTTSASERVSIVRKSAAATVTSLAALKHSPNDPAALAVNGTAATGHTGTAEGTDTDIVVDEGFNVLNGWNWVPTPEERILVPQAGIISLKFLTAPASQVWYAGLVFREWQ